MTDVDSLTFFGEYWKR